MRITPAIPLLAWLITRYVASYRDLPRSAWVLAGVVVVHNSGRMVSTFLAIYLLAELGLSESWIGAIVTAYGAGAVLGSILGGRLCGRLSAAYVSSFSLVFLGLAFFCLSAIAEPFSFSAVLFAAALFEGMFRPPVLAMLMGEAAPTDRPRFYALYQTSSNLGQAVGALAGGIIAELYFPMIFWADGGTSLLAAAILLFVLPITVSSPRAGPLAAIRPSRRGSAGSLPLIVLCLVGLLNYCVLNQRLSIYPLYLTTDYGLRPSAFGILLTLNGLMIAGLGVLVADRLKSNDQRWVASLGSILLCGSFALLPLGAGFTYAALTCIIMTFGEIIFMPAIVTLVYGWAGKESAGASIGMFFAILSACRALGPILGIWAFTLVGPTATWLSSGGLGVVTAGLLLSLQPLKGAQAEPSGAVVAESSSSVRR